MVPLSLPPRRSAGAPAPDLFRYETVDLRTYLTPSDEPRDLSRPDAWQIARPALRRRGDVPLHGRRPTMPASPSDGGAMAIELRVIGCFGFRVDGVRVDISPVPARILAYLALHRGDGARVRALAARAVAATRPTSVRSATCARPCGGCRPAPGRAVAESGTTLRLADHVVCDLGPCWGAHADVRRICRTCSTWAWRDELLAGWYDDWVLDAREALQVRRADAARGPRRREQSDAVAAATR